MLKAFFMVFLVYTVVLANTLDTPFMSDKAKAIIFAIAEIAYIGICLMIIYFSTTVGC